MKRLLVAVALVLLPSLLGAQEVMIAKDKPTVPRIILDSALATASCTDASISCGQSKSGTLDPTDCIYSVAKVRVDLYAFQGTNGTTVTIDETSLQFDTYLALLDPAGNIFAENDDTTTSNSQIVVKLNQTGTWKIAATSYYPDTFGDYTVRLSCQAGVPDFVNLTPYRPTGWSDRIVVTTTVPGSNDVPVDAPGITVNDNLYVSWAVINNGNVSISLQRTYRLYLDGVLRMTWTGSGSLDSFFYESVKGFAIGRLSAGPHTLEMRADPGNTIAESNESDNSYTKIITVAGSGGSCVASAVNLCLNAARFRVSVAWQTTDGNFGQGTAISMTGDTGYFWFFSSSNVELVVKVLDGRGINGRFWVFYGALSNVSYTITVVDAASGTFKTYKNPQGSLASVADTAAF